MKKFITAMAMTLSLAAMPSFAQYEDDYEEYVPEEQAAESSEYAEEAAPAEESAPAETAAAPAAEEKSSGEFKPLVIGGRFDVGFTDFHSVPEEAEDAYDEWAGIDFSLGVSLRYYFTPMIAFAPEANLTIRYMFQTYEYSDYWYTYEYEIGFTQLLLDFPLLARVQPIDLFYAEAGIRVGFSLFSEYSLMIDDVEIDDADWPTNTFNAALVLGAGVTLPYKNKKVDVGIRFTYDFTALEEDGDAGLWAIKLAFTYHH